MLNESDMPGMFQATDEAAKRGRRSTFWRAGVYLGLLVVAAVGSAVSWESSDGSFDFGAALASAALFLALLLAVWTQARRPEAQWYAGRAGAESIKSVTWLYCVHGAPYDDSDQQAKSDLVATLHSIMTELKDLEWPAVLGEQVSVKMANLREADWPTRQDSYMRGRIEDQLSWYGKKAKFSQQREKWLSWTAIGVTGVGMVAAVLQIVNVLDIDVVGVAAAGAASITAWAQAQQHRTLASAYALAAQELGLVKEQLLSTQEADWAQAVSDAEEAISREHTMWLARRGASTVTP